MKRRTQAVLLSTLMLATSPSGLRAQVKDNPYQDIVTRNAFALKPLPPPVPAGENTPPPSPVDVLLTGISTLGGTKKVLLQITDKSPGKNKTEYPPPLVEGDIQGRVEVVSINSDEGKVVIKIDGNEKTLGFDKDAPKAGGAAPNPPAMIPGMMPGMPPPVNPAGTVPLPGVTTAAGAAAALNAAGVAGPAGSRGNNVMVGGGAPSAQPTAPGYAAGAAPGGAPGAVPTIPVRPVRTYPDAAGGVSVGGGTAALIGSGMPGQVSSGTPMTREQAIARIEELRRLRSAGQ